MKITILEADKYPLPCPVDLMTCLTGGCKFSKLDLSLVYQQMSVNIQRGLYKYLRSLFRVSLAPALFQKGCILWGMRVLVPKKLPSKVLEMLHKGHTDIVKVK